MKVTCETQKGLARLRLSGKLMFDDTLLALRRQIGELVDVGMKRFVLDFSEVPHCDSSGCGELITAYVKIQRAGGVVALAQPNDRVRLLWSRIKLTDVFPIFDTVSEAETFVNHRGRAD